MKKFILPALAAAFFGVSLMAAVDTGDTKGTKSDCPAGCCSGKECKDSKAKAKVAKPEAAKPEAPKA